MGIRKVILIVAVVYILYFNHVISFGEEIVTQERDYMNLELSFIDKDLDGENETEIQINRSTKEISIGDNIIDYTGYLSNILYEDLTKDGSLEIIIAVKDEGTSSYLSYKIYDIKNIEDIRVIFERNNIYKGILEIHEGKIIEKTPIYLEEDSNAVPSQYKISEYIYSLEEEGFIIDIESFKNIEELEKEQPEKDYYIYYENPDRSEIEALIEEVAMERAIPPIILKSIAYTESNLRQFKNGKPLVSFDGISYGIMQVTPSIHREYDEYKLKYDIRYNIEAGADILLSKWGYAFRSKPLIPQIGDGDPRIMENWYFAIWAYNGWSECNNPNMIPYEHKTWVQNKAYQNKVLDYAESEFGQQITKIDKNDLPETGLPDKYEMFATPQPYHICELNTYKYGDIVINMTKYGLSLRNDDWEKIDALSPRVGMMVVNGPALHNGYIRYKVSPIDENGELSTGWVAMNWIKSMRDSDFNGNGKTDRYDVEEIDKHRNDTSTEDMIRFDMNYDEMIDYYDVLLVDKKYEISSAYEDYEVFPTKTGVSYRKDWIIKFNQELDSKTVNNENIYIKNRENGEAFTSFVELLNDNKTVKIHHPSKGYTTGNTYLIVITKNVKAYNQKELVQPVIMEFVVD
ncbi:Ig-like domain-containing protein [Paramaledivibacter caminithermalis]|uniref:Transglycosylase SLT domain-containing protein n=1 Tax=Paramaledivibacter caminithermalis (strain DSM 15212 / CIP 107654 / DViRD3) TaxID=1121301 RepID=A0A1M6KER3_PARC5|nr:Ig-like domain-containing protein [Paramaledivibacter caminithermalis]SHJ57441.1 Transglycosylase SLT domain-containing protein [Paramaledivibacter caminithermalis DSM 15212]